MSKYQCPAEVRVLSLFRARFETIPTVEGICRDLVERCLEEPLVSRAEFLRDAEEENVYAVTIRFAKITDLEKYLKLSWRNELVAKLLPLLEEEPERRLLEAVEPVPVA